MTISGGTWEHKMRQKEMTATREWADELTKQNEGKHHLGDFLPPDELKKFLETYTVSTYIHIYIHCKYRYTWDVFLSTHLHINVQALKEGRQPDLSDYKEFKLTCDNIGYKMLMNMGWEEGQGLGSQQQGRTAPVDKWDSSLHDLLSYTVEPDFVYDRVCPIHDWVCPIHDWVCPIHDWVCPIHDWVCPIHDWVCPIHDWVCSIHDWVLQNRIW